MATTAKMTIEEFLALPDTRPASELIDGEVVQKPMPTMLHGWIQRLLSFVFTLYLHNHPAAFAGSEVRCILGPAGGQRGLVPDFVVIMHPAAPDAGGDVPYRGAPDLAVEILSPEDRWVDVMDKVGFYLKSGVRLVWLINPGARTVVIWSTPSEARTVAEDGVLDGGDILPGFTVPVRDILPPAGDTGTP